MEELTISLAIFNGYVKLLEGIAVNMVKCMAFKTPMIQWSNGLGKLRSLDIKKTQFYGGSACGKGVLAFKPLVNIWVVNQARNCGTLW